jgi:hypothetical protein
MLYQFLFFALAPTEVPGREVSIVAIAETVLVLAGGTAILSILFGVRVAMRAVAGGATAPRSDGGQAAGGSGTPDVAGVIALPPLIVLGFPWRRQRCSRRSCHSRSPSRIRSPAMWRAPRSRRVASS